MWVPNQIVVHNDGYLHKLQNILMFALHASCQFNLSSSLGWKELVLIDWTTLLFSLPVFMNFLSVYYQYCLCWNLLSATSTATSKLSSLLIISGLHS